MSLVTSLLRSLSNEISTPRVANLAATFSDFNAQTPLEADEAFARSNSLSPRASLNDAPNLNAASKGVNSVFALQNGTQPPQLRQLYFSPAGQGGSNQQAPPTRPVAASAAAVVAPPAAAAGSSPSQERVSRVLHGMNSAEFYDFVRQL